MIAIIAGTGSLPIYACKSLLQSNKDFFVISLFPNDNGTNLEETVNHSIDVIKKPFYKTKEILNLLKERGAKKILFIGKVDKQNLLKRVKLDWFAVKLLAKLAKKSDFSIMNKIEEVLQEHDIEVIPQNTILKNLFVPPGIITGKISTETMNSIKIGMEAAKLISTIDIGQTVIVKDKMILAIEAIEGTNNCIKRGISLGKKNIIVCKSANKGHNKKFDLPTIGPETLNGVEKGEIEVIAWQSNKTFIADKEHFIAQAKKLDIALISL